MSDGATPQLPPFQRVLDEHADGVWRFLCARVGRDAAADRYQETMLAALRAYPDLDHTTNLGGWLFTIARRKLIDAWRREQDGPIPVADPPETPVAPAPAPDRSVWAVVRALPDGQRDAVTLRYGADLAYREIAAQLGCSEAAARQRVHAGLRRLRELVPAPDAPASLAHDPADDITEEVRP